MPHSRTRSDRRRITMHRRATNAPRFLESLERRVLLSSLPTGLISTFTPVTISGWAYNKDDGALPVDIEITINGSKTTLLADDTNAAAITPTGSPYHGFSFSLPALPPGNSKISVVAISPTTGLKKLLRSGTLANPAPIGQVAISSDGTHITGWAHDASSASPIQVRIDVDGVTGTPFTTDLFRQDIATRFKAGEVNFGFDVAGSFTGHVVEVFALDAGTNQPCLLYTNNKKAKGKVEVNDGFTVSGYAQDPDNPTASIQVRVTVDGITLISTPVSADGDRPDLVPLLGSANHGFSVAIPGLTPGKHVIAVYAIDGQASSAAPVLLQSKTVTNAVPVGHVDSISSTLITGYALDPDLGADPTSVNVYVDDTFFGTVVAAIERNDLVARYHSPNHGFSVDLSSLPAGSHSITLTVDDNRTSDATEVVFYDNFINNHTPIGVIESVDGTALTGWAYDPDATGMGILVDVYVDGVYAKTVTANESRPDVASLPDPNHGFTADLPAMSFGTHKIDLYAAESQGNVSVLLGSKTVTNSRPISKLETADATTVSGWAADGDRLGESVEIQVFVNGVLAVTGTANIARPDLLANAPFSAHPGYSAYGFSLTLTGLVSGANQVDVYAVDLNNQLLSPIASRVITV